MTNDLDLNEVEVGCSVTFPFATGYIMAKNFNCEHFVPHLVVKFPNGKHGNVYVDLQHNKILTFDVIEIVH